MRGLIALAALALAGCAQDTREEAFRRDLSADLPKTGVEQQALIGNLFQAYTTACAKDVAAQGSEAASGTGSGAKRSGKHQAAYAAANSVAHPSSGDPAQACMFRRTTGPDAASPTDVNNYLAAGFALSDYLCETFFRHVNKSARERHHERGEANSVGTLMGTILSLSHAGAIATGVNTATFGALDREFQNFDDSYLVAPDLSNLRHLVLAAQDNMRQASLDDPKPKTMFGAESTILRYADLCSFLGMQDLLAASVKEKADDLDQANTTDAKKGKQVAAAGGKGAAPPVKHAAKEQPHGHGHHAAPRAATATSGKRTQNVVIERALLAPPPPAAF